MTHEWRVIRLKKTSCTDASAVSRNRFGDLRHSPTFTLREGTVQYTVRGRKAMWSFLDALFPGDPLPRAAVEDDLFAPLVDTPSMREIVTDLMAESDQEFLQLWVMDDVVSMAQPLTTLTHTGLATAASTFDGWPVFSSWEYGATHYNDGKRSKIVPSVVGQVGRRSVEVLDLGRGHLYVRCLSNVLTDEGSRMVCCRPPEVAKNDDDLMACLTRAVLPVQRFVPSYEPSMFPGLSGMRTHEQDRLFASLFNRSAFNSVLSADANENETED